MACAPWTGSGKHCRQSGWDVEALACQDTTSEADEGGENFPAERGVDRMNKKNNNYDARLWDVLEKGKMADLSQFHQQGFFDETPLYTRESDTAFLPDNGKANEVLLRFALKFLRSVIAYEQHSKGYFAAITVWDFSEDRLVPNIFAWCRPLEEMEPKLALKAVTTAFGKRIVKNVPKLGLTDKLEVLEDTETEPGSTRVFVGPMTPPYQGFLTLDNFRDTALSTK
jgi:hypothetical protein